MTGCMQDVLVKLCILAALQENHMNWLELMFVIDAVIGLELCREAPYTSSLIKAGHITAQEREDGRGRDTWYTITSEGERCLAEFLDLYRVAGKISAFLSEPHP